MFSIEYTCSGPCSARDTQTYEGPREEEGCVVGDYRTEDCEDNGSVEGEEEYRSSTKPLWEYKVLVTVQGK